MSGFKELKDVSKRFRHELKGSIIQIHRNESDIEEKLKKVTLSSSKLKLITAVPLSRTPCVLESVNESTLAEYADSAAWNVQNKISIKFLTQSHVVTALINAPNSNLDAEMIKRKEAILNALNQFNQIDSELKLLNFLSKQAERQKAHTREAWQFTMGDLRSFDKQKKKKPKVMRGWEYYSLSNIVEKLEVMRWVIGRLICAPSSHYDWLEDPHRHIDLLPLTRQHYSVEWFTTD